jgi:hypothetical protein
LCTLTQVNGRQPQEKVSASAPRVRKAITFD